MHPPQCRFESLASELLLEIMLRLSDLESLDNLLRASPIAFRLFDAYGLKVFEAVLSGDLVTHEFTRALIRIVALVRAAALPPQWYNLDKFIKLITRENTAHLYDPHSWHAISSCLPSDSSASMLRGLLATHRRMIYLTVGCLKYSLHRFKSLRPSDLVDRSFHFKSERCGPDNHYVPSWQLRPAKTPYPIQDIGPPSWVEEQRILRAFWRIELSQRLRTAARTSRISWPQKEIEWLDRISFDTYCLAELGGAWAQKEFDPSRLPGYYFSQQDNLLEHELMSSALNYIEENRETIDGSRRARRNCRLSCRPRVADLKTIIDYTSPTYKLFHHINGRNGAHKSFGLCSPIQHVSFEPFRRLGFAIWDSERMCAYGLLPAPNERTRTNSCFLAWKSILGKDTLAEVERLNKIWDELVA